MFRPFLCMSSFREALLIILSDFSKTFTTWSMEAEKMVSMVVL